MNTDSCHRAHFFAILEPNTNAQIMFFCHTDPVPSQDLIAISHRNDPLHKLRWDRNGSTVQAPLLDIDPFKSIFSLDKKIAIDLIDFWRFIAIDCDLLRFLSQK